MLNAISPKVLQSHAYLLGVNFGYCITACNGALLTWWGRKFLFVDIKLVNHC